MEFDKNQVIDGLNDSFELLKAEMYDIVNEMADVDNNLISRRAE